MAEHSENAAGNIMSNIMETIAENIPNKKSVRFEDGEGSISDQAKKLFGGGQSNKKSIHHVLGGGKSADVLLWRNKKISSSVLGVATLVWIFFEWLDYHFLTMVSFLLVLGMAVQFAWANVARNVPRVEVPEELFANAGAAVGAQVNKALGMLQDISCGRDLRRLVIVIGGLFAAAIIGSFCNFLTVIYIAITLAQILYDPSAMWPTGWLPPSPPPPQQVPQGNQPPPPPQQQQQQGIPNNPYAANNGGAAAAGGGHHPLFGLGQQGFYGYGGAPTLNPAQTTMTEQEAYRQILMALEQNKQQALQQLVQACTGGALYPPQYPLYNYSAAATPSPNARETWPRTQPHNPFAYFSRDHQNVQGTPNTQEIPPTNTRSVPSPNVPPDVMNISQVFSSYTDGGSAHGSDYQRFQKDSHSERQGTSSSKLPQQRTNSTNEETYQHENEDSVMSGIDSIIAFQERQLRKITNGYSNFLGNGAFGEVYLGTLHDGQKVAVKVPIRATETCITDLKNELRIQSRIKHRNVVKLLGYCLDGDAPKLVYEFAPNGNLYEKLHGRNKIPMPLDVRLRIALECAEGLAYIHSSTETCILHGDVKSANILLDDNLGAKVSDFGLSRLLSVSSNTMYTSNVRGSFGYIDPMFMAKGVLTQKSDVYSFGVVLVELITRRKARDEFGNDLAPCFQSCFSKGNMLEQDMVDKEIATRSDKDLVEGIANIAFQCLNANVKERPEMKKVAYRLAWLLEHRHGGGSLIRSSLNHHN